MPTAMRQALSPEGFANIFANFLGQGLERLVDPSEGPAVYAVADMPVYLLEACCNNLRIRASFQDAYVVVPDPKTEQQISPNELTRRMADDNAHMVVFLPADTREQADLPVRSFTPVDTFRNLEVMEQNVIQRINKVPVYKRITTIWHHHAIDRIPILKRLEYLINVLSFCIEAPEMGGYFHQLDLLPDRALDATGNFADRLARNVLAQTILCNHSMPLEARLAALQLEDDALKQRLAAFLSELGEFTPASLATAIFEAEINDPDIGLSFDQWRFSGETGWN